MRWWNPWTWWQQKIDTTILSPRDLKAIQLLRDILEGEQQMINILLARIQDIQDAPNRDNGISRATKCARDISGFESTRGFYQTVLISANQRVLKGTVLEPILADVTKRSKR